jgi:hypothetical protein
MLDAIVIDPAERARLEARLKRRMALKRREYERHAFRLPITVSWGDARLTTTTRMLGLGGLFVGCDAPPEVGTRVALTLTLDSPGGHEELDLAGEVVYLDGPGMGVKFVDMDAAARGALRGFFIFQDLHCYNTENLD